MPANFEAIVELGLLSTALWHPASRLILWSNSLPTNYLAHYNVEVCHAVLSLSSCHRRSLSLPLSLDV